MLNDSSILRGTLHVFVAFDWGDELDLDAARRLVPAESQDLARRRRTPSSIGYRPAPLRYPLAAPAIELPEVGPVQCRGRGDRVRFRRRERIAANSFRIDCRRTESSGWIAVRSAVFGRCGATRLQRIIRKLETGDSAGRVESAG